MQWDYKTIKDVVRAVYAKDKMVVLLTFLFFVSNSAGVLFHIMGQHLSHLIYLLIAYAFLAYIIIDMKHLFSIKGLSKFVFFYSIYQVISYFIGLSLNIADTEFNFKQSQLYPYFQSNYITPLLYTCIFGLFILIWRDRKQGTSLEVEYLKLDREEFLLSQFMLSFIVSDSKFLEIVQESQFLLAGEQTVSLSFWVNFLVLYAILTITTYIFVKGFGDLLVNQGSSSAAWTMSCLLALLYNYAIQSGIQNTDYFIPLFELQLASFLFQVIILTLLFFVSYLLVNRFLGTTVLLVMVGGSFSLANHLKYIMRQEPILPSDLGWLGQLLLVFSFVEVKYILGALVGVGLALFLFLHFRKTIWVGAIFRSTKERLIGLTSIFFMLLAIAGSVTTDENGEVAKVPIISTLHNTVKIDWLGNTINANVKSLAFVWIKQLVTPVMEKPAGYSQTKMQEIEEKYSQLAQNINHLRSHRIEDQTVIYILSESFSDPSRIPGTEFSRELTPYLNAMKQVYTSGLMKSDGYGGGTANMEFQSLTGLAMYNMSPSVSTIYTEIATSMRFLPSISDQFDPTNRIAIHLESGNNYSRNIIYSKLDFASFIGTSNTDTVARKISKEGLYPSDASTYQYVLDTLTEEAQFYSVITMQNHIPWSAGLPEDIQVTNDLFSTEENEILTSYGRLLNRTDDATQELFNQLASREERITVVFYGDHLPGLYKSENFDEDPSLQYKTDYLIWSNFPTNKYERPLLNSSDFIAALLETTDSKVSPYYALLTEVMNYSNMEEEEWTPEAQEVMEDLKLVEYDLLKSKGYLTKDSPFFKIGD